MKACPQADRRRFQAKEKANAKEERSWGQMGPCGVDLACGWGIMALAVELGAGLFIVISWVIFSVAYLSLSLGEPCGFCLRDEGR